MARIRTIKPEFWTDEAVGECSPNARLLFLGTLNFADDHGGIERSSKQLKAQVFPYDAVDCEVLVQELLTVGLLVEYEVSGKKYLHIKGFRIHQKVEKPGKPRVPLYEESVSTPRTLVVYSGKSGCVRESKGREGKGREARASEMSPSSRGILGEISANAPRETSNGAVTDSPPITQAAAACIAMRAEGLVSANPSHPLLLELLGAGAEIGEFAQAARDSCARGKDFAYALGVVRGRRADAVQLAASAPRGGRPEPVRTWEPPDEETVSAQA